MTEKQSQRSRKSPVQLAEKIVDEATATINRQKEAASNVSRSYWGLVTVALYILLIQAAGIAFFTKGFLLSRPVVEDTSLCAAPPGSISTAAGNTGCWMDRTFDRAVVIIVDALRFDFVVPTEDKDSFHSGQMPFMYQISTEQPQNALLLKFMADPPTTTLQRLKGLTTGSLPTFIDAGSNFAGTAILEDNWVTQFVSSGKRIAFAGDDTWMALYSGAFNQSHPFDSFNVWDLDTVDNGVISHMSDFFAHPETWDMAIGHMLGVDHAGHRYGPNHLAMRNKLEQTNEFIKSVTEKIDDNTLLVVMGDHGMDTKGDHGGESLLELEAALWMYSKKPAFGRVEPLSVYDIANNGANYRSVSQIDLVPTLSLLLGLPVPFSNLGFPIPEAFLGPKRDIARLALANHLTAAQIATYCSVSGSPLGSHAQQLFNSIGGSIDQVAANSAAFQSYTVDQLRNIWVRFNVPDMAIGGAILGSSLLVLVLAHKKLSSETAGRVAKWTAVAGTAAAATAVVLDVAEDRIYSAALGNALGSITALLYMLAPLSYNSTSSFDFWTGLSVAFTVLHAAMLGSNSYTVREDMIVNFLLATFGVVSLLTSFRASSIVEQALTAWHSLVFLLLTRLQSLSTLCREEHGPECETTFYLPGSSVNRQYAVGLLAFASIALPLMIKSFYTSTRSFLGPAVLWLRIALPALMAISTVYWLVEGTEVYDWPVFQSVEKEALHTSKLLLARIGLGATVVAANYAWYVGGLCIKLETRKDGNPSILGYSNIYGSYMFLFVLNLFGGILMVNKSLGGVVLCLLVYQLLTLLELLAALGLRQSTIGPVVCALLGMAYFFSTGHQATLPSIQWEIAFVWSQSVTFPVTHLALIFNTFGPFILTSLVAALIPLWRNRPYKRPQDLVTRATKSTLVYAIYMSVVSLASAVMAYVLRRHLMVWKIFAPRYMLGGLSILVVDFMMMVAVWASGHTVSRVSELFA